jgi:hypothetical protein
VVLTAAKLSTTHKMEPQVWSNATQSSLPLEDMPSPRAFSSIKLDLKQTNLAELKLTSTSRQKCQVFLLSET